MNVKVRSLYSEVGKSNILKDSGPKSKDCPHLQVSQCSLQDVGMALNILHPILSKTQWQLKLCCESFPKILSSLPVLLSPFYVVLELKLLNLRVPSMQFLAQLLQVIEFRETKSRIQFKNMYKNSTEDKVFFTLSHIHSRGNGESAALEM